MLMLTRRKPLRSNIARVPQREFHHHRKWVRGFCCLVKGCEERRIEFAHIRLGSHTGKDQKPYDWHGVPLCWKHHADSHRLGEGTFAMLHGLDLQKEAAKLADRSPDLHMRAVRKEMGL